MRTYPGQLTTGTVSLSPSHETKIQSLSKYPIVNISNHEAWRCNRGLPILIRMENNTSELHCLCPPSYYGNVCQYQNQRVSLTLQIRVAWEWRTLFNFVITLIDDHIEYLSIRDCDRKFNIYLLYSTRPKYSTRNYSVQIDAFNKLTMNYRDRCEYRQTRIDISFHDSLTIPASLFVHFVTVQNRTEHIRTSTTKNIPFDRNFVSIYISIEFNIAFAEIFNDYYLIVLREQNIASTHIVTQILPSHRCASIHELLNETLVNQNILKSIKYYQIPCEKRLKLICFYDDSHFCLCDIARRTNCFKFDHNITYDCGKRSLCENDAQCFQDDPKCPTSSICVCRECYYGSKCQFSTKGSTLSLDNILGYQINHDAKIGQRLESLKLRLLLLQSCLLWVSSIVSSHF
jgi:hypothetical protein